MHDLQTKQTALSIAKQMISNGATLDEVADKTEIGKPTLRMWLTALGDEYADIRKDYVDNLLTTAIERIDESQDFLSLARAKQQWVYSTWIAERRDSRYSPVQQQVAVQVNLVPPALAQSASALLDTIYTHTQAGQGQDLRSVEPEREGVANLIESVVPPISVGPTTDTSGLSTITDTFPSTDTTDTQESNSSEEQ